MLTVSGPPPADQRAGLLTQGAVLAGYAHPVHPAPVLRGKFLLEQLTCRELGQPPAGAEGLAPPDTLDVESTNRERLQAVTSSEACIGCHQNINPAGFAFEKYFRATCCKSSMSHLHAGPGVGPRPSVS